jgi:hypothetical protein
MTQPPKDTSQAAEQLHASRPRPATQIDPVRMAIDFALADAAARVRRARGAVVRALCGGVSMHAEQIRSARAELARALADRAVAEELDCELQAVDGEPT